MTETQVRRSPRLPLKGATPDEIADSVRALEERPYIPRKTPASTNAVGYDGEICRDGNYIYIHSRGTGWKRAALSSF
jgi:hypothetical protein